MINKILLSLYLIIGVMLVVTMLLYSLDGELEIMENQDRDYQEYIQREARWEHRTMQFCKLNTISLLAL